MVWYAATVDPPPSLESELFAVAVAVNLNALALVIESITYSWFNTAAVMLPPSEAADEKVT